MSKNVTLPPAGLALQDVLADKAVFVVSFFFVLLIALVAQVLFLDWRKWFPGAAGERSLVKGVRAAVYTFMSHME